MKMLPLNLSPVADVAAKESGKYAMTGVQLRINPDDTYDVAGTDGKALVVVHGRCLTDDSAFDQDALIRTAPNSATSGLIPGKNWKSMFKDADKLTKKRREANLKAMAVSLGKDLCSFSATNTDERLFCQHRYIEGVFPNYNSIIPKPGRALCKVTIDPELLAKTLKTVSTYTEKSVTLEIHPGVVCIRGQTSEQKVTGIIALMGEKVTADQTAKDLRAEIESLEEKLALANEEIRRLKSLDESAGS